MVSLPAQIRDAIVRGDYEQVPPEFRELVEKYVRYLMQQKPASGR